MKKAPTMKDVATEAGVALGTVSKVFNGIPVGEEYKKKVEEAADKLGYKVNNYARSLKTNKSNTIAVILPIISHPFFAALAEHLNRELKKRSHHMLLFTTEFNAEAEQACFQLAQQNKVDGIICLSYNPNLDIDPSIPFVSIDRYYNATVPCVASDNFGGGYLAAQKLVEFGCSNLLGIRSTSHIQGEADKRELGFGAFCRTNNLKHEILVCQDTEGFDPFYRYLDQHIENGKLSFDGIFCGTDHLAIQVCNYLRKQGIRVPEDVQVIGFDGNRNFFEDGYFCSTIVQPTDAMAKACVDIVLREDQTGLSPLMCLPVSYAYGGTTRE